MSSFKNTPTSSELESLSDRECFALYKNKNNKKALGEIFRRHADMAYRLALRYLGNATDAEDVLQRSFLHFFERGVKNMDTPNHVRAWLMQIVINDCKMKVRGEKTRRFYHKKHGEDLLSREKPLSSQGDSLHEKKELQKAILDAIDGIPVKFRMPVWMTLYEKLSVKECASTLLLKEITFRKQVKQGLLHLRKTLSSSGIGLSGVALAAHIADFPVEAAPEALKQSFVSTTETSSRLSVLNENLSSPASVISKGGVLSKTILSLVAVTVLTLGVLLTNNFSDTEESLNQGESYGQAEAREPVNVFFDFEKGLPLGVEVLSGKWVFDENKNFWRTESEFFIKISEQVYYGEPLEIIVNTQKIAMGKPMRSEVFWCGRESILPYLSKIRRINIRAGRSAELKIIVVDRYIFTYINNKLMVVNDYESIEEDSQLLLKFIDFALKNILIRELKRDDLDGEIKNPEKAYQSFKGKLSKRMRQAPSFLQK